MKKLLIQYKGTFTDCDEKTMRHFFDTNDINEVEKYFKYFGKRIVNKLGSKFKIVG